MRSALRLGPGHLWSGRAGSSTHLHRHLPHVALQVASIVNMVEYAT